MQHAEKRMPQQAAPASSPGGRTRKGCRLGAASLRTGLAVLAAGLLSGCAGRSPAPRPMPPDPDLSRLASAAQRVFLQSGPERAIPLYREALHLAYALDAPSAIRPLAFNLAACLLESGRPEEAEVLLGEARAAAERIGEPLSEILVLAARVALRTGDSGSARSAIEAADHAAAAERRRDLLASLALLRVELALDSGDIGGARRALDEADQRMDPRAPLLLLAQRDGVRARVLMREDQPGPAAEAWESQARHLGLSGLPRSVPVALQRATEAYAAAGNPQRAADCGYRAARSWMAQGRGTEAAEALAMARTAAAYPEVGEAMRAAVERLGLDLETRD